MTLLSLRGRGKPGRAGDRARRRPPADPLHLPERHPRHRLPRLGTSVGGGRALPVSAVARARAAHRRHRDTGKLRRQRLHVRGHRRPRARRVHLRPARRERIWSGPAAAEAGRRSGQARVAARVAPQGRARPSSRASSRSCSRTPSSSSRRTSTTGGTRSRRSTPSAGSSRSRASGPRWTCEMTNALEKIADRAVDREDGLQRRAEGERLQPPRARAGPWSSDGQVSERLAAFIYRWRLPLTALIHRRRDPVDPPRRHHAHRQRHHRVVLEGGSGLQGLRALPRRVRRHPLAHRRAEGRLRRASVLAGDAGVHRAASRRTSNASTPSSASTAWRRRRSSRPRRTASTCGRCSTG